MDETTKILLNGLGGLLVLIALVFGAIITYKIITATIPTVGMYVMYILQYVFFVVGTIMTKLDK